MGDEMPSERFIMEMDAFRKEHPDWVGLDVGCGGHIGKLAEYGLDAAPVSTFVIPDYPREKFTQGNIYKMPFKANSFDYVVSAHVIEHLKKPITALREMIRVAKYMIIANVPRYTRKKKVAESDNCVSLDLYYFSAFPNQLKKFGLTREDFPVWSPGATTFNGFEAPHCAWYPFPEDLIKLFNTTKEFKKLEADPCPGNCGENNIWGWLK